MVLSRVPSPICLGSVSPPPTRPRKGCHSLRKGVRDLFARSRPAQISEGTRDSTKARWLCQRNVAAAFSRRPRARFDSPDSPTFRSHSAPALIPAPMPLPLRVVPVSERWLTANSPLFTLCTGTPRVRGSRAMRVAGESRPVPPTTRRPRGACSHRSGRTGPRIRRPACLPTRYRSVSG